MKSESKLAKEIESKHKTPWVFLGESPSQLRAYKAGEKVAEGDTTITLNADLENARSAICALVDKECRCTIYDDSGEREGIDTIPTE